MKTVIRNLKRKKFFLGPQADKEDNGMSYEMLVSFMRENFETERVVWIGVPALTDKFWCDEFENEEKRGFCSINCRGYTPRNGKSGICKHYSPRMEPGDIKVLIKI